MSKMDLRGAVSVLYSRIIESESESEPEHVTRKIIGYILQKNTELEMIRLALAPDDFIRTVICNAKFELGIGSKPILSPPLSPSLPYLPLSPPSSQPFKPLSLPSSQPLSYPPLTLHNIAYPCGIQEFKPLEPSNPLITSLPNDYYFQDSRNLSTRPRSQSLGPPDFPPKLCHYFSKGFCRNGSNCRYIHGSFDEVFGSEDQVFSPRSLEKLEMEITEILKSRKGNPISIASLPMIYLEKYGRTLQAEGYLTESQRHGKSGYNLTKLLGRLRNSIRLIDRPHGQHSVILAEDAPKYMGPRSKRNDPGSIISGSRQIYLTFPAESMFTEEEVSDYFSTFGPVQDVRIPCQQKRMFGFVTFVSSHTVKMILSNRNPHYVSGNRVLAKPYRGKSKVIERKYPEKLENPICNHSHQVDIDLELQTKWESSRMLRQQQLIDEQEVALGLEMMHLSKLQLARTPPPSQSYLGYYMDDLKVSQDHSTFQSAERFNFPFNVMRSGDDNSKHDGPNYFDQHNNQGLNLPDSPFASTIETGTSNST